MRHDYGGTKTDTVIKLLLFFFVSVLSFSVGTYVGKKFSDKQKELGSLESDFASHDRGTASTNGHFDEALTDEDISRLAEEFVNTEKESLAELAKGTKKGDSHDRDVASSHEESSGHGDNHAKKPHKKEDHGKHAKKEDHHSDSHADKDDHHAVDKSQLQKVQKAADRVAKGMEPIDPHKKVDQNRVPNSLPAGVSNSTIGKYTVQISSHQAEGEAKSQAEKFKSKGFPAYYVKADIKGTTWYRVSVGVFPNRNDANVYKKELLEQAHLKSAIVQKIVAQ